MIGATPCETGRKTFKNRVQQGFSGKKSAKERNNPHDYPNSIAQFSPFFKRSNTFFPADGSKNAIVRIFVNFWKA